MTELAEPLAAPEMTATEAPPATPPSPPATGTLAGEPRFGEPRGRIPLWAWLTLAAVVVLGWVVRMPMLGGPIVGYHSFNEAFYLDLVRQYLHQGLFAPWTHPLDPNNPPLYPFLLRLAMTAFGSSILTARAFSAVCALGTALLLFFLGRRLYGDAAGLIAASAMALAPAAVLVGRNVQIDALLGLLFAATLLAWVKAADDDSAVWAAGAGVLAGLCVLSKLQGAMIVPTLVVAELWRMRSWRALVSRRALAFAIAFVLVGVPWEALNLLHPSFVGAQAHLAGTAGLPDWHFLTVDFATEWFWALSPLMTVLFLGGVVWQLVKHRAADVLVLAGLLANLLFYAFFHHHTYYLYAAIPFAALSVASLAEPARLVGAARTVTAVAVLSILLAAFGITMLAGKKLGYWSTLDAAVMVRRAGIDPRTTALAVSHDFRSAWGPALLLYADGMQVISNPLTADDHLSPGERIVTMDTIPRRPSPDRTFLGMLPDTYVAPIFFGYAPFQDHNALFYFAMYRPALVKVGPPWQFGFAQRTTDSPLYVYLLSPAASAAVVRSAQPSTATTGAP